MSESAKRGDEPREGVPGEGTKAPRRLAHEAPAGLPALRSGMASWTTPDLSRLPRRPLDLPDVRSGGRRGPRGAAPQTRRCAAWSRPAPATGSGRAERSMQPAATSPAPSRAPSGPGPRSASAGEMVDDALENDSTRVPGDAEKRPRGNPATRVRLVRKSGTTSLADGHLLPDVCVRVDPRTGLLVGRAPSVVDHLRLGRHPFPPSPQRVVEARPVSAAFKEEDWRFRERLRRGSLRYRLRLLQRSSISRRRDSAS